MTNELPPSQTLMPGLRFEAGNPWHLRLESIDVLRGALGNDLTNAFVRSFAVADRLQTILDCIQLNDEHVGRETVRGERNLHTLGVFAAGLVYELREAVRQLRDNDLASRLSEEGQKRWARLLVLAEPTHEDTMGVLRNCIAFHAGAPDIVQAGIDKLSAEKRSLVLATGDGGARVEVRHDFGLDVIFAGMKIRPHDVPKGHTERSSLDDGRGSRRRSERSDGESLRGPSAARGRVLRCPTRGGCRPRTARPLRRRALENLGSEDLGARRTSRSKVEQVPIRSELRSRVAGAKSIEVEGRP